MSIPYELQRERLFDLLADRALVGLGPAEDEELARLLVGFPETEPMALEIEVAAAAVAIAAVSEHGSLERMPSSLRRRIEESAQEGVAATVNRMPDLMDADTLHSSAVPVAGPPAKPAVFDFSDRSEPQTLTAQMPWPSNLPGPEASGQQQTPYVVPPMPVHPSAHPPAYYSNPIPMGSSQPPPYPPAFPHQPQQQQQHQVAPVIPLQPVTGRENARATSGRAVAITGWLAAAACLLLAVGTWYFRPRTQVVTVNVPTPPPTVSSLPSATVAQPTPEQERDSLLARAGTARLDWTKNAKDPASKQASGDVVWNAVEQRGYMRFRGLAKNDKRANVYQLWIFDKSRDDKYPVDGGVFSVEDDGDVIVPIKAKLPVGEVALFAVTVEKPGGVVVSKRERIVVTAKPPA
jgi:hypothetical protein